PESSPTINGKACQIFPGRLAFGAPPFTATEAAREIGCNLDCSSHRRGHILPKSACAAGPPTRREQAVITVGNVIPYSGPLCCPAVSAYSGYFALPLPSVLQQKSNLRLGTFEDGPHIPAQNSKSSRNLPDPCHGCDYC
ncbi:hypothetical protein CMEL01_16690, partial [Colletotrichum melonis]